MIGKDNAKRKAALVFLIKLGIDGSLVLALLLWSFLLCFRYTSMRLVLSF